MEVYRLMRAVRDGGFGIVATILAI
jgi:hypothetical protein